MTVLSMTLGLERDVPLYIPRRDIVASRAEDLTLRLTMLKDDDPGSLPLSLVASGAVLTMTVRHHPPYQAFLWDYGFWGYSDAYPVPALSILWQGTGVLSTTVPGQVTISVPTTYRWPARTAWSLVLDYDGDLSEVASGVLNLRGMPGGGAGSLPVGTVPSVSIGPGVISSLAAAPAVSLGATALTFASTAVGASAATQTLVLTNTGAAPLIISAITPTGDFSISSAVSP